MSRAGHRHPHQLTDVAAIKHFVLAGRATLTLKSVSTGTRFTFRVDQAQDATKHYAPVKGKFWVKVLTRPDHYEYLGRIEQGYWKHTQSNKLGSISVNALSSKAWAWFWRQINHVDASVDVLTGQCEVWHEGSCGRCGRALTVSESIANGIGPECAQAMMAQGLLDSSM